MDEVIDDLVETIIYFYGNPKGAESYRGLAVRIIEAIEIGKIPGITKTPTVSELMRVTENANREDCEAIVKMLSGK